MKTEPLNLTPLGDSGCTPLYLQVKRALLGLIESGACRPGQSLPNETTIARGLGVVLLVIPSEMKKGSPSRCRVVMAVAANPEL